MPDEPIPDDAPERVVVLLGRSLKIGRVAPGPAEMDWSTDEDGEDNTGETRS